MDTSKTSFSTTVQQYNDTQDLFIEIPHYILQNLDWQEGDELAWSIKANQIILTKIKNTTESREELREINITEGTEKDWEDFWYNSESEGKEFSKGTQELLNTCEETFYETCHEQEEGGY